VAAQAIAAAARAAEPDHPLALADLNPELHSLALGIPAGVFGEGEKMATSDRAAASEAVR
jgi:hypothetical protein